MAGEWDVVSKAPMAPNGSKKATANDSGWNVVSSKPIAGLSGLSTFKLGKTKVTFEPDFGEKLMLANTDMMKSTGKGLVINSSYRSRSQQEDAYRRYREGKIALAAKPGHSRHERGLAADIQNWEEAAPYLAKYGITNPFIKKGDPGHFQLSDNPSARQKIGKALRPYLEGAGAVAGGIVGGGAGGMAGSIVPFAGTAAGAIGGAMLGSGLGYSSGARLADLIEGKPMTVGEAFSESAKDALIGSALEGGGQLTGNVLGPIIADQRSTLLSSKGLSVRAGERLNRVYGNLTSRELDQLAKTEGLEKRLGIKPLTPAQRTGSTRLAMAEQGFSGDPEFAHTLATREQEAKNKALLRFTGLLGKEKPLPTAQSEQLSGIRDQIESGVGKAERNVQEMRSYLPLSNPQETGRGAVSAIEEARIPEKKLVGRMYENLGDRGIAPTKTAGAIQDLEKDFRIGEEDVYPSAIVNRVKEVIEPPAAYDESALNMLKDAKMEMALSDRVVTKKLDTGEYSRLKSGMPGWFRNKGYNSEQVNSAIDRVLSGKEPTASQRGLLDDILQYKKKEWDSVRKDPSTTAYPSGEVPEEAQPTSINFQNLHALRKRVGRALNDAMSGANPNREMAMKLQKIKEAIDSDIDAGMGEDRAYASAKAAFREYASKYRSGQVGKILQRGNEASGRNIPDGAIAKKLFTPDGADDFIRAVGKEKASKVMEGHAITDMRESGVVNPQTGEINGPSLAGWLQKNRVVLDKYGMSDAFGNLKSLQDTLDSAKLSQVQFDNAIKDFYKLGGYSKMAKDMGSPEAVTEYMRPHVVEDLIKSSSDANGNFSVQKGLQYLQKHSAPLKRANLEGDLKAVIKDQMPGEFKRMLEVKRVDRSTDEPYFTLQEAKRLVKQYGKPIKELYGDKALQALTDYHQLLNRLSKNKNVTYSGGSTTFEKLVNSGGAQDTVAKRVFGTIFREFSETLGAAAGAGAGVSMHTGAAGASVGAVFGMGVGRGLKAGYSKLIQEAEGRTMQLVKDAILDPALAEQLMRMGRTASDPTRRELAAGIVRQSIQGFGPALVSGYAAEVSKEID